MSNRILGVPKPVPPEPGQAPARKLKLDVGGFAEPEAAAATAAPPSEEVQPKPAKAAAQARKAEPRRQQSPSKPKPAARAASSPAEIRRKRNALLPHRLVPHLRDRAHEDGVPHGEVVIDAFVNHIDEIRADMAADRRDAERRAKLGLPPRRRRQPRVDDDEVERRVQVGLYMPERAISVIEEAAEEFGISWSYLVSLLLDRELV
jgi:hypothetical protein